MCLSRKSDLAGWIPPWWEKSFPIIVPIFFNFPTFSTDGDGDDDLVKLNVFTAGQTKPRNHQRHGTPRGEFLNKTGRENYL